MDAYRRQLAAQLAQIMLQGRPENVSPIPSVAVGLAAEIAERLRAIEAEEAADIDADRCPGTHPLDAARCIFKADVKHDLCRDDRGRSW